MPARVPPAEVPALALAIQTIIMTAVSVAACMQVGVMMPVACVFMTHQVIGIIIMMPRQRSRISGARPTH